MATRKAPAHKPAPKQAPKKRGPRGPDLNKGRKPPPKSAAAHPEDKPLTEIEQRFVLAYTTGETAGDPQAASIEAGYSPGGVTSRPYEVLARPNVARAVAEAQARIRAQAEQETGITLAKVVAKLGEMTFFEIHKFFDDKGCLLQPKDWPPECAAAVAGIEVLEEYIGKGPDRQFVGLTKKLKLIQRHQPADMLMKHLGGYEQDNKQKGDAGQKAIEELTSAIRAVQSDDCRLPITPAAPDRSS